MLPLAVRGLVYANNGQRFIDGVDLRLEAQRRTVVLGPNGAGKTLLLRLLHGLLVPTAGQILWGGAPLTGAVRLRQAMVFQRPVMLRRSVAANIRFALGVRRELRKVRSERTSSALERAGLALLAGRPARVLSGGEQQRLAIARALALDPDVVFLDEPTASLDPASVIAIEDMVLDAHERGTKVIFVTHDLSQARRLADDVVFLHRGRVAEHTPASRFFERPDTEPARAFVEGRVVA